MNNNSVGECKERYLADKDGNQSSPTRLPGSGTSGHKGRPNERLPDGFASQIIELEIEVDRSDVSIETVNELLSLYSQAIDYYVSIQSDKYKYFKKKMTLLIIMPQVVESMEVAHQRNLIQQQKKKDEVAGHNHASPPSKDFEAQKIAEANNLMLTTPDYKKVDYLMRRQEFETNKNLNNITKSDRLKEIVNEHQLNSVKNTYLVQSNLKSQMESLNEKLLRRKRDAKPSLASSISGITIDHPSTIQIGEGCLEGGNRSSSIELQEGGNSSKLKRRSSQYTLPQNPIDVFNALKNKIKDEK